MAQSEPTIGKWNDDNYIIDEPKWLKAYEFAKPYYEKTNRVLRVTKKENGHFLLRQQEDIPYIKFLYAVDNILVNECNKSSDLVRTMCALYGILENGECTKKDVAICLGETVAERIEFLTKQSSEPLKEYINRISASEKNRWMLNVVLAAELQKLRMVSCPFDSYIDDIAYYNELEEAFSVLKDNPEFCLLMSKLAKEIEEKKTVSRNCNKTSAELFAGWDF